MNVCAPCRHPNIPAIKYCAICESNVNVNDPDNWKRHLRTTGHKRYLRKAIRDGKEELTRATEQDRQTFAQLSDHEQQVAWHAGIYLKGTYTITGEELEEYVRDLPLAMDLSQAKAQGGDF